MAEKFTIRVFLYFYRSKKEQFVLSEMWNSPSPPTKDKVKDNVKVRVKLVARIWTSADQSVHSYQIR